MSRVTYHRECRRLTDCEAPLVCFGDIHRQEHYCTDSECVTDAQCLQGQVCQSLAVARGGFRLRRCAAVGVRQEGESCLDPALDPQQGCRPELVCGGRAGRCGRPCRLGEAASCPEGFFCGDVEPEPICLPTCEGRECPPGQQCVHHRDGVSACAVVHGTNCQQAPCPGGAEECEVNVKSTRPAEVWMRCFPECDRKRSACPDGLVCDRGRCQPPCDPTGPDTCAPGFHCTRRTPRSPYLCEPDFWPRRASPRQDADGER
jgi:hypothetical protein